MTSSPLNKWLAVFSIVYLIFAFWAFIAPVHFAGQLGFELASNTAFNEFRANYGGMFLGTAIFLALAARNQSMAPAAFLMLSLALGGLALGRAFSFLVDGNPGPALIFFMFLEAASSLLALTLYRKEIHS